MKKKILYIGNKLSKHGYTPTVVETLGKQLEEDFDIVTVSDKKNLVLRLLDMLFSVVKNRKADYVLIDTYSSLSFNFAYASSLLCRLFRKKYIPILHGGNLPYRVDHSSFRSKQLFKRAFLNVSPSGYLKYEFEKRGYDNVVLIQNNIEIKDYTFTSRSSFAPKLLWVRCFDKTYNCPMALDVLKNLVSTHPDAELCMVGPDKDGSLAGFKELCKQYGLEEKVTITGRLGKQEWRDLSTKYDVFLSTTNFDNTPVSLIEAMALGLPVISTNVGGVPFLLEEGKTGYMVDKNDASAMADKIRHIISHPEEAADVARNARKYTETFGWESVRVKWLDVLK